MKLFLKNALLLLGFFVILSLQTFAQGREIMIFLKDKSQKSGELLSVRDSAISFLTKGIELDEDIKKHPELVNVVLLNNIDSIRLEEVDISGAGTGALIGAGVGVGWTGLAAASASVGSNVGSYSGLLLIVGTMITAVTTLAGTAIGAVVAELQSEDAETIRLNKITAWRRMKEYARFDEKEPTYVREIIDNLLKEAK